MKWCRLTQRRRSTCDFHRTSNQLQIWIVQFRLEGTHLYHLLQRIIAAQKVCLLYNQGKHFWIQPTHPWPIGACGARRRIRSQVSPLTHYPGQYIDPASITVEEIIRQKMFPREISPMMKLGGHAKPTKIVVSRSSLRRGRVETCILKSLVCPRPQKTSPLLSTTSLRGKTSAEANENLFLAIQQ